jgi:hypothetical protein
MANLSDIRNPGWPDIFRVETTTPWVGGENGTVNMQASQSKTTGIAGGLRKPP